MTYVIEGVAVFEDELDVGDELGHILVVVEVRRRELLLYCRQIHGLGDHLVVVRNLLERGRGEGEVTP